MRSGLERRVGEATAEAPRLLFDSEGEPRAMELREGSYYIGRLTPEMLSKAGAGDPWGVYVYSQATGEVARVGTGPYYTVSRLHARINVSRGRVEVVDHGPRGEGSKNGTYVNGVKIRGGSTRLLGASWIRLGSMGPLLLYVEGGLLRLVGGVPVVVPEALVTRNQPPSLYATARAGPGEVVIVPRPGSSFTIAGVPVVVSKTPEQEAVARTLRGLADLIAEVGFEWSELGREDKLSRLRPLRSLEAYRRALSTVGGDALAMLDWALEILERGGDESEARRQLKQVYELVKRHLEEDR